ncbi:hypothetical protein LCGC14_0517830 [marine sediment metagenome]|uniref:Uncharacterized protein n=1 Tax=marine sediment metagenome TaxID=412755 RepID=A0A0F9UKY3_9ZZZZ
MNFIEEFNSLIDKVKKHIKDGDYAQAAIILKDKLAQRPEVTALQFFYFKVLIKLNRCKEARFWLKEFIARCRSLADVYYYKSLLYFLEGKLKLSMESLKKCFNEKIYYLKKLFTDDNFDALKETKEFKELIAPTKVFQVNKFISLKLIFEKSLIYICDELFLACNKVALSLAPSKFEEYSDFDDIDKIIDFYKSKFYPKEEVMITPEEEFWAHCSNMQAWVDNDYNTCILSKNLSFPILTELSKREIPYFKILFKEELITRIKKGGIKTLLFFLDEYYLNYLTEEDLFDGLLPIEEAEILKNISQLVPLNYTLTTFLRDSRRFWNLRSENKLHFCIKDSHITELEILVDRLSSWDQYREAILQIKNLKYLEELALYGSEGDGVLFLGSLYNFDDLQRSFNEHLYFTD